MSTIQDIKKARIKSYFIEAVKEIIIEDGANEIFVVIEEIGYLLIFKSSHKKYSKPIDNKAYKYFNIYEQKMGGLYYKCLQASEQSKSKAKINFTLLDVQNAKGAYTVVYGYNEALAIDNYEINIID